MSSILKSFSNNLCKLSGEDFTIIEQCSPKIRIYFTWIGVFVLAILLCCFLSAFYFTDHLFHNKFVDVGVGFVWGYIITNIYVLLLYTITPALLPVKIKKKKSKIQVQKFNFSSSMILRVFMMMLLAIITAQPLNVFLLQPNSIELANDIKNLLAHNSLATLVTVGVVLIFMLPIYLKYRIRKLGEFYKLKGEINKRIVEEDYKSFKEDYKRILEEQISKYNKSVWTNLSPYLEKLKLTNPNDYHLYYRAIKNELTNERINKYEYWADPPYRTIKKTVIKNSLSEKDLLNLIYPKND